MRYTITDGNFIIEVSHELIADIDRVEVTLDYRELMPEAAEVLAELQQVVRRARAVSWYSEFHSAKDMNVADQRTQRAAGEHAWLLALAARAIEAEVYERP